MVTKPTCTKQVQIDAHQWNPMGASSKYSNTERNTKIRMQHEEDEQHYRNNEMQLQHDNKAAITQ